MRPILAGIETEYGIEVEGHGAEDQVEDAKALVRSTPGKRFFGWDYAFESPRSDLRGFQVEGLSIDPRDAEFDAGKPHGSVSEVHSDCLLPNGARFYNDHGHPEWATPECWSLQELALQDLAGELAVLRAARAFEEQTGRRVRIYKNNTDFHGASYGCHESYLVPRKLGFERLFRAVTPILIARQVLCGAGKVGSESGGACPFQLSQRADFFTASASVETLFRRPVFNTRDEPHADSAAWIRLHVISGDANMIPSCTILKAGLVKLALWLEDAGETPVWRISDPVRAFQQVSRDESHEFRIQLEGGGWTTAVQVLESYSAAAERVFSLCEGSPEGSPEADAWSVVCDCRRLLSDLSDDPERFATSVDWAAKRAMLEEFLSSSGSDWQDKSLTSYDLSYHLLDLDEGLYFALEQMGRVQPRPDRETVEARLTHAFEPTRAMARGLAVDKFSDELRTLSWGSLTFGREGEPVEQLYLAPDRHYSMELREISDVRTFMEALRGQP